MSSKLGLVSGFPALCNPAWKTECPPTMFEKSVEWPALKSQPSPVIPPTLSGTTTAAHMDLTGLRSNPLNDESDMITGWSMVDGLEEDAGEGGTRGGRWRAKDNYGGRFIWNTFLGYLVEAA